MRRLLGWTDTLRANFFALPAAAVVGAYVAARVAVGVDVGAWVGDATVDSARAVLSTVAAATITFASISFSVSMLIMQQGSSQFSPRVIPALTRDPFNRRVIALVLATFTYCLVVLQRVRGPIDDDGDEVVPRFAVAVGLLLGLIAVLAVVAVIHHTSRTMDVSEILDRIVGEAVRTKAEPSPLEPTARPVAPPAGAPVTVVHFDDDGWVRRLDRRALIAAVAPGGVVTLATDAGRYALRQSPVCTIWPSVPADEVDEVTAHVREAVRLGPTRTMAEDAGYGVRQLVDVALKGLSPGVNDPTTARDAIFHLGTVLVARLTAPAIPVAYRDGEDRVLVAAKALTDDDLAELAVGELRLAAAPHPAVCTALLAMIADVVAAARRDGAGDRAAPLVEQARLLVSGMEERVLLDHDRRLVRRTYEERFGADSDT